MLRQDWFVEDTARGWLKQLGKFFPKQAVETTRRIQKFAEDFPTVLLPAHDAEAASRLASKELLSARG